MKILKIFQVPGLIRSWLCLEQRLLLGVDAARFHPAEQEVLGRRLLPEVVIRAAGDCRKQRFGRESRHEPWRARDPRP